MTYLNISIYTVAEAARLTGVSKECIRRWVRGYRFRDTQEKLPAIMAIAIADP
jgi:hypothetical protein